MKKRKKGPANSLWGSYLSVLCGPEPRSSRLTAALMIWKPTLPRPELNSSFLKRRVSVFVTIVSVCCGGGGPKLKDKELLECLRQTVWRWM